MFQKPKGFTQNCTVLFDHEGPQSLIMWLGLGEHRGSIYRVTQQWLEDHKAAEEYTLYLLREELEQLPQAAENYEAQGAHAGGEDD